MQETWISGGSSLLAIFQAIQDDGSFGRSSLNRRGSFSQQWPGVLTNLSSVEVALLQDLFWWGPLMESRLQKLAGHESKPKRIGKGDVWCD